MLTQNSPTLQRMIASVKPGEGNMQTAQVSTPGQFQQPYPTPKDMVMNAGMMNQPMYGYPQPMGYYPPYPTGYGMMGFQTPASTITMINGVPIELEYNPQSVGAPPPTTVTTNYISNPGAPTNPDLAHLEGKTEVTPTASMPQPGRYAPVGNSNSLYGQYMTNSLYRQPNIVGGYNPYYQSSMSIPTQPTYQDHPDIRGVVDIYNGELVHPHVNSGWYGSTDFPFIQNSQISMKQLNLADTLRQRFNEKFPGYNNPYMPAGFMQTPTAPRISPEMQDMANIAAFYGMTYDQFITNGSNMMKLMSRQASKYFGRSDDELAKRQKLYNVKYPRSTSDVPDNDTDLFYPNGAFDYRGQLTKEYQETFCVSRTRMAKLKNLKVSVVVNGEEVKCTSRRKLSFAKSRDQLDKWLMSDWNYNNWLNNNRIRFIQQYSMAPERKIDHIPGGNVFMTLTKSLAYADQYELEQKLIYQNRTRSASMFNRDDYISTIKGIRDRNKANKQMIDQRNWNELVHKVAGLKEGQTQVQQQAPLYKDRPYICDGDWVIAKPGVDIVGLPLDQSVNKIVKLNTVTGEEEIYDPNKLTGIDVRERIKASLNPSFNEIDEDELSKRLERFEVTEFKDF